jgi:hypothetical protein
LVTCLILRPAIINLVIVLEAVVYGSAFRGLPLEI